MTISKDLERELEKLCQIKKLMAYEFQVNGEYRFLPVIIEKANIKDGHQEIKSEIIRLRAFNPKNGDDFTSMESCVEAIICHEQKLVCFGPRGWIIMRPRKVGLGSVMFSYLIDMLKVGGYGDYKVVAGTLYGGDAENASDRVHRNGFYIGLGFTLSHSDEVQGMNVVGGRFTAENVSSLIAPPEKVERLVPWVKYTETLQSRALKKDLELLSATQRNYHLGKFRCFIARLLRIEI